MANKPQRHVRLRLARRRTAPARVRPRAREESLDPPSSDSLSSIRWWRRPVQFLRMANWVHVLTVTATAIGVVAAVGGLWAQAVTTYFDMQVAKDQLKQTREADEDDKRTQASLITYWVAESDTGPRPHIVNRSLDSVSGVYLVRTQGGANTVAYQLPSLAPCTESVVDIRLDGKAKDAPHDRFSDSLVEDILSLKFVDRAGVPWMRSQTSLSEWTGGPGAKAGDYFGIPSDMITVRKVKECSAGGT